MKWSTVLSWAVSIYVLAGVIGITIAFRMWRKWNRVFEERRKELLERQQSWGRWRVNELLKQGFEEMQKESNQFDQEHAKTEQEIKDFKEGMKRKSWRLLDRR